MSTSPARPAHGQKERFIIRLLNRCISLLPYLTLPGYFPGSPMFRIESRPEITQARKAAIQPPHPQH
jgi:hypothetical protein